MRKILLNLSCCLLALLFLANTALAQDQLLRDAEGDQITVSGEAFAVIPPDTVEFRLIVEAKAPDAQTAGSTVAKKQRAIVDALIKLGIADLRHTNEGGKVLNGANTASITPGSEVMVRNSVLIQTNTLDRLHQLIDEALKSGAAQVADVRYSVQKGDAREKLQAVQEASQRARQKAEVSAKALGLKLGPTLSIILNEDPTAKLIRVREQRGEGEELPGASDYQVSAVVSFALEDVK